MKSSSVPAGLAGQLKEDEGVEARQQRWVQILLAVCGSDHNATLPFKPVQLPQQYPKYPPGRLVHLRAASEQPLKKRL